jgi:4-amino-4-deoxy-L-arabinose transferase-like glycosyltransferase
MNGSRDSFPKMLSSRATAESSPVACSDNVFTASDRREPWSRVELAALLAVLGIALIFRVYQLDFLPAGAQHDEVFDSGFALSIVHGARPIFFDANGGVPVLFMYLMAPAIALFGRTLLVARAVAVACGLLGLVVSYLLLRRLLGRAVALLASAAMAVSFWHLFSSRTALEPITVPLIGGLAFYLLWRGLTSGRAITLALAGAVLGLSLYTYHSGPLIPLTVAAFAIYLLVAHRQLFVKRFRGLALCALVALVVTAPMAYHLLTDTEASSSRVRDLAGNLEAARDGDLRPVASGAFSVVGMFGWQGDPEWRYNLAGRPVFDPLGAALFYAGFLIALWRARRPEYAFLVIWLLVNLLFSAVTLPSPSTLRAVGGIAAAFAFPAITITTLWRWAGGRWGAGNWRRTARTAIAVVTVTWVAYSAASLARDYFVTWANAPQVREVYRSDLAELARYLDANDPGDVVAVSAPFAADLDRQSFEMVARLPHHLKWFDGRRALVLPALSGGDMLALAFPSIGQLPEEMSNLLLPGLRPDHTGLDPAGEPAFTIYRLSPDEVSRLRPSPTHSLALNWADQVGLRGYDLVAAAPSGGSARLILYWRVLSSPHPPDAAAPIFSAHLLDSRGVLWSQENYQAFFPSQWSTGDTVVSWLDLPVPVDTPPGIYRVALSLIAGGKQLVPHDSQGPATRGRIPLDTLTVTRGEPPAGAVELHARFPRVAPFGPVRLLGATAEEAAVPGEDWLLALYWRSIAATPDDLTITVRVEGAEAIQVLEWRGGALLAGGYPTSRWRPGEYLRTLLYVPIPADQGPSKGRVRVNLYDSTGRPLANEPGISVVGLTIGAAPQP